MSLLNNILSAIDGEKATSTTSLTPKKPMATTSVSRPVPRPAGATNGNGTPQLQAVKRKAEGPPDGGQAKIPRKDGAANPSRPNSANSMRPVPTPDAAKAKPATSISAIPYRGTAGLNAARPAASGVKRPSPTATSRPTVAKPAAPASKPAAPTSAAPTNPAPAKKGYAAILAAAKAREQTKPIAPPIKHEPTKVLTKKERLELRAKALGKKVPVAAAGPAKAGATKGDPKADIKKERKPADIGYQGTARPKKPVDIGYKGTARPAAAVGAAVARKPTGPAAAKAKAKPARDRYDGYLDWSDVGEDDVVDDEEDGYESSDMEAGGFFDIDEEEQRALKAAKAEDAKALAEEMEAKRLKEERKRKLMAMNSAAAGKRRY